MSVASVVNAAGNIINTVFDLSPKQFYSIRDFYNFIKKRQNAPMAIKHFTVVPKCEIFTTTGAISKVWDRIFTDSNLAKFSILIQEVKFSGQIGIQGKGGNGYNTLETPAGRYTNLNDGYNGSSQKTIEISFLQTATPIIQTFIVPWYYETLRTRNYGFDQEKQEDGLFTKIKNDITSELQNAGNNLLNKMGVTKYKWGKEADDTKLKDISQYPCPKLTLDIKYYRMDQIAGLQMMMNPSFIYRITGVMPVSFSAPITKHGSENATNVLRTATFAYNNVMCLPNATYEETFFNGGHTAFQYKNLSPVQILNSLNSAYQDVTSIANTVKGI